MIIWNGEGNKCMEFHWACLFNEGSWEEFEKVISHFAYVYTNFSPCSGGCARSCPILKHDSAVGELCCESARQCCFTCLDVDCPIKEVYRSVITVYGGIIDDDELADESLDPSDQHDVDSILDRLGKDDSKFT
jgi:hypothetical protein